MSVETQLTRFIDRYIELQTPLGWPAQVVEEDWPSACFLEEKPPGTLARWKPAPIAEPVDMFDRLGHALETEIHPDLVRYYTQFWSDPLYAKHSEGRLSLLFCWNDQDIERLRSNLIGHALAKQKQRRPLTLFFALTEPEGEQIISIENDTGAIWLERPGRAPSHQLAANLESFLADLDPLPYPIE